MKAKWLVVVFAGVFLSALAWVPGLDPVPTGVFAQGAGAPPAPGAQEGRGAQDVVVQEATEDRQQQEADAGLHEPAVERGAEDRAQAAPAVAVPSRLTCADRRAAGSTPR